MKIVVTQRLLDTYPNVKFAAILAEGFHNSKSSQYLEKEKSKVCEKIRKIKDVSGLSPIKEHKSFHEKFGKSYPIEFQVKSIKEGKSIPTESVLRDVLFISEMKHYCIISGHDIKSIDGKLQLDLSSGKEYYTKINGKTHELKPNDIILKAARETVNLQSNLFAIDVNDVQFEPSPRRPASF